MGFSDPLGHEFLKRILCAAFFGGLIGLERQLRGKPVGIRTSALICVGTLVFVGLGIELHDGDAAARVLGQVVTGIGFLGAGVILNRDGLIKGMTSAAVIWVLAGIGAALAFGHFEAAGLLTALTLTLLSGIRVIELGSRALRRGVHAEDEPP